MTCQSVRHNRSDYLRKICTCDEGRRANNEYNARKKAEHKARTASETNAYHAAGGEGGIPSIAHGEPASKEWRGCQCVDCLSTARARRRNYSRNRRFLQRVIANQRKAS